MSATITNLHVRRIETSPPRKRGLWQRLASYLDARRTCTLLAALDDRELADIGVSRAQLRHVASHRWQPDTLR